VRLAGGPESATTAGARSLDRQWTFHGVGISVPASWPRNALHCKAPLTNTVVYPHQTRACAATGDTDATRVEFSRIDAPDPVPPTDSKGNPIEIDGTPATESFRQLPDGRQAAEVRVPSHNITITITSPDAGFAAHLAELEIYIVKK
jgi:hypothetical protein